jgi:CBS domain-containing protein
MDRETVPVSRDMDGVKNATGSATGCRCWAQDLMLPNPVLLLEQSTIWQAIEVFRERKLDSVLVMTETSLEGSPVLAGRIRIKDILRLLFPCLLQEDPVSLNEAMHQPVQRILIRGPQTVGPWSDVRQILSVMLKDFTEVAGVEQDGKLIGQVCGTALLRLFSQSDQKARFIDPLIGHVFPAAAKVSEAMAGHILCLWPQNEISKAVCVFLSTAARHIPILDREAKLKGIVSQQDILDYIAGQLNPAIQEVVGGKKLILDNPLDLLIQEEFATISWGDNLLDAATQMIQKNTFCLAVTDIQRKFSGILSCSEILHWLYNHLPKETESQA